MQKGAGLPEPSTDSVSGSARFVGLFGCGRDYRGDRFKLAGTQGISGSSNGYAMTLPRTNRALRRSRPSVCHSERMSVEARDPTASAANRKQPSRTVPSRLLQLVPKQKRWSPPNDRRSRRASRSLASINNCGRNSSGPSVSGDNVQTAALVGGPREISFDRLDEGRALRRVATCTRYRHWPDRRAARPLSP